MFRKNVTGQAKLFLHHVLPAAIRPVHTLWHEIIGFLFIVMAVVIGGFGIRAYSHYNGDPSEFLRIVLSAVFTIILAGFGVSSFRKARNISRS